MEGRTVVYPVLEGKIAERGFLKGTIAGCLGMSPRHFSSKLSGKPDFTWTEVKTLHREFFPDVDIETLMTKETA